jgi:hypothetical protein
MSSSDLDLAGVARKLVEAFVGISHRARTAADGAENPGALATARDHAFARVRDGDALLDEAARVELRAIDPELAARIEQLLETPLRAEAEIRASVAAARVAIEGAAVPLHRAMTAYRSSDESRRRAARAALDLELERLAESTKLGAWTEDLAAANRARAQAPERPPAPTPSAPPARGLVIASAEIMDALALGGPFDLQSAAKLASDAPGLLAVVTAAEPSRARSVRPDGSAPATPGAGDGRSIASGPDVVREGGALLAAERDRPSESARSALLAPDFLDLVRALAETVAGAVPATFGAWRAAGAGTTVADFRPAPELALTSLAHRARALPFEQPLVPIARPDAVAALDLDAASAIAHLIGLGALAGDPAVGTALALTAPTRIFADRGLAKRPSDRARARRTLGLALTLVYVQAAVAAQAAGDVEALRDHFQDALFSAPPAPLARWWAAEHAAARAAGERGSIYLRSGGPVLDALRRGVMLASRLRDAFDEDWFRSPHATIDRISDVAAGAEPATERAFTDWVRAAVD